MTNTNAVTYDYYTLDQARDILEQQYEHDRLVRLNRRTSRKVKQQAISISHIKQKLQGFSMVSLGMITPLFLQGDITASMIIIPMGLYVAFKKDNRRTINNGKTI